MKNIQLYLGLFLILLLLIITFIGPYLPFVDHELERKLFFKDESGKITAPPFPPNEENVLGTDREGRDILSRIIIGSKETLLYLVIIVVLRYMIAIPLGVLSFWYKGIFHLLLTLINQIFSRLPTLFTVIIIMNIPFFIFSPSRTVWIILLISLLEVGRVGDIIHKHLLSTANKPFIDSGIVAGISPFKLLVRYFFPTILPQLIVNFVIDLGRTMLLLGQLGLFSLFIAQEWIMLEISTIQLKLTSNAWPLLLNNVVRDIRLYPWIPFYATVAITYVIITFNLLGEGMRKYYSGHVS